MKDLLNLFNQQRQIPDFDAIKIALAWFRTFIVAPRGARVSRVALAPGRTGGP